MRAAGSFLPNQFGLFDTLGNMFEWVEDCWHDSYDGAPADGAAWVSGDCGTRVQRGGAWGCPPDYLRTAVRGRQPQGYRYINAGMRVLREIAGEDGGPRESEQCPPEAKCNRANHGARFADQLRQAFRLIDCWSERPARGSDRNGSALLRSARNS
jgi:Sulfatase-modifying factor enzyme 1